MGRKKSLNIVKEFKNRASKKIPIEKVILFGSRANGKPHKWSDFDLIIVSDKFKGTISYKRVPQLYEYWTEDYPVDFLCYTTEEFNKLKNKISIVKEAIKKGIIVS